ncbi:glycosyltransferase [Candidatus Kaiserbacteria bacterium]|nr:glycosyltransferase [Candidatus Kaiserbacteria bacterium]
MSEVKLSIIIPCREEETTIEQTVKQFMDLRIPHEIIVSDGKSKDRTVELARQCAHVTVVFDGEKHTAGIGRNDGARASKGEFLLFIDAGVELPEPQKFLERALAHFENQRVAGLTCSQRAFPAIETWADRLSFGYLNAAVRFQNNVLHRGEANGKFMLVRRAAFEAVRGFREDLPSREDGDFFLRLSKVGRTVFDPRLMIYHAARRAHAIGWARLWWIWTKDVLHYTLFDKSSVDDWTPIR